MYYGDSGLGDQLLPWNNVAIRFSITTGSVPGLAYPITIADNAKQYAVPIAGMFYSRAGRNKRYIVRKSPPDVGVTSARRSRNTLMFSVRSDIFTKRARAGLSYSD